MASAGLYWITRSATDRTGAGGAMRRILRRELPQHAPGAAAVGHHAALVGGAHAVDPDAVEADGGRIEARGPRGQIVHPTLLAAPDPGGVEEHQVRPRARQETATVLDAIGVGHRARHRAHRLLERQVAPVAYPVPEEMETEARVAEEGEMRARVRERHRRAGMPEELGDLLLVGVEEPAVEHGLEVIGQPQVEEDVERLALLLAGQLADGPALEIPMLGFLGFRDGQVVPVRVADAIRHAGLAHLF